MHNRYMVRSENIIEEANHAICIENMCLTHRRKRQRVKGNGKRCSERYLVFVYKRHVLNGYPDL